MTFISSLPAREQRALRLALALAAATLTATAAGAVFGARGAAGAVIRDWASSVMYVIAAAVVWLRVIRVKAERGPWSALAIGISTYAVGNVLWAAWLEHESQPPIPSVCDVLWLSLYPLSYVGLIGLAGVRRRGLPAGVWLDGIVAGLGIAALGSAAVFPELLSSAKGSTIAVATELAYPVCDLVLVALVVGVLAVRRLGINRTWALLGIGFTVLAVADCMYALQVASGSSSSSVVANFFYLVGIGLLALAAWHHEPSEAAPRVDTWSVLLVPGAFALGSLALLAYGQVRHLHPLPYTLALLALLFALIRTGLTFKDVRTLAETRRQARTDELTSLANRRQLIEHAEQAIATASECGAGLAVMMVDLDDFKEINDTLGHHAGDLLLTQIGPRLRTALRSDDVIARLGGDEFSVVLAPTDAPTALIVAQRVLAAVATPFQVEGLDLTINASVGIALFPAHGRTALELLRSADEAMYAAKTSRAGVQVYGRDTTPGSGQRLGLARELARGIERGELENHYQPQADVHSGQIVGIEALVRWNHPVRGLLEPVEFLRVAERAGLARNLTRAVLGAGLDQLALWLADGFDLRLAVNVTLADLLDTKFPTELHEMLTARELPAASVLLEIKENALSADPARSRNSLARLGEIGIGLSLDNFGSTVSSLIQLRSASVGEVKLDRVLIGRMTTDPIDTGIVRSTVAIAHQLGMRVVAQGVEDHETSAAIAAAGCDCLQGFVLSRPVPAATLQLTGRLQPRTRTGATTPPTANERQSIGSSRFRAYQ